MQKKKKEQNNDDDVDADGVSGTGKLHSPVPTGEFERETITVTERETLSLPRSSRFPGFTLTNTIVHITPEQSTRFKKFIRENTLTVRS